MELLVLPSNYPSQHDSLDDPSGLSRAREPLSDSAGNAQLNTLASAIQYHDTKRFQPGERPYSWLTVPSQPPRPNVASSLELRRHHSRRRRYLKYSHNPIADSPQYQNYRERLARDPPNGDEVKWPDMLEEAFLEALMNIPAMGRCKFTLKGKPHGRNELISEYLWIAYTERLNATNPGAVPDPSMRRHRKQVSSHIQVLKGFMKDHPAYTRLFPPKKSDFVGSFKHDPCLRALEHGRLPTSGSDQYSRHPNYLLMDKPNAMRPVVFWVLITSSRVPTQLDDVHTEEDFYNAGVVTHKPTGLSVQRPCDNLSSISNWRQRFPYLEQHYLHNDISFDIIHMDVTLDLMKHNVAPGSELYIRMDLSLPRQPHNKDTEWRIITTLTKPMELYQEHERPVENQQTPVSTEYHSSDDTRIKIPFPAKPWANAFACLTSLQAKYEEARAAREIGIESITSTGIATGWRGRAEHHQNLTHSTGAYSTKRRMRGHLLASLDLPLQPVASPVDVIPPAKSAREYVDQISMYQEVQCSLGRQMAFECRTIIVWTFKKAREGENGAASWRYLDPNPPRSTVMSPSPGEMHSVTASMNENFNQWASAESPLHHMGGHSGGGLMDPFQGLATPPHIAGLQSPFGASAGGAGNGFSYPTQPFEIPDANMSFVSTATVDSETTLVDEFFQQGNVGMNASNGVHLAQGEYDQNSYLGMQSTERFEADPAWVGYSVPNSTPVVEAWDGEKSAGGTGFGGHGVVTPTHHGGWSEAKGMQWIEEEGNHDWVPEARSSPEKGHQHQHQHQQMGFMDQSIEQHKLLQSWSEEGHPVSNEDVRKAEVKDEYHSQQSGDMNAIEEVDGEAKEEWEQVDAEKEEWEHVAMEKEREEWTGNTEVSGEDRSFQCVGIPGSN